MGRLANKLHWSDVCGRTGAIFAFAVAFGSAACTSHLAESNHVNSLGCYIGNVHLKLAAASVRPGQTVSLRTSGQWHVHDVVHDVSTGSYGMLGTARQGRFVPIYYLSAITADGQHQPNVPVGRSVSFSGVGLPNRPFRVLVPPVHSGEYFIKFDYTVSPTASHKDLRSYSLCARLHIVR